MLTISDPAGAALDGPTSFPFRVLGSPAADEAGGGDVSDDADVSGGATGGHGGPTTFMAPPVSTTLPLGPNFFFWWYPQFAPPIYAAFIAQLADGRSGINIKGGNVRSPVALRSSDSVDNAFLPTRLWATGNWTLTFKTRRTSGAISTWGDRTRSGIYLYLLLRGLGDDAHPLALEARARTGGAVDVAAYRGMTGLEVPLYPSSPSSDVGDWTPTCRHLPGNGTAADLTRSGAATWKGTKDLDCAWTVTKAGNVLTIAQVASATTRSASWTDARIGALQPGHLALLALGGTAADVWDWSYSGTVTAFGGSLPRETRWPSTTITFGFPETGFTGWPSGTPTADTSTFTPFPVEGRQAVRRILAGFAAATGLTFTEVAPASAQIRCGLSTNFTGGNEGHCYFPPNGSLFLRRNLPSGTNWAAGSANARLTAHELGHGIGLRHPFDLSEDDATSGLSSANTIMTHHVGPGETMFPVDIEAVNLFYANEAPSEASQIYLQPAPAGARPSASATTAITFPLKRSGGTSAPASVAWAVTAGAAPGVSADDFQGGTFPSGTATFAAGEDSASIVVTLAAKAAPSAAENAVLTLSSPTGGTIEGPASASFRVLAAEVVGPGGPSTFMAPTGTTTMPVDDYRDATGVQTFDVWWGNHGKNSEGQGGGFAQYASGSVKGVVAQGGLVSLLPAFVGDRLANRALYSRVWPSGDHTFSFTTRRTTPAISSWGDRTHSQLCLYAGVRGLGDDAHPLHLAGYGDASSASTQAYRDTFKGYEIPLHRQTPSAGPGTSPATCARLAGDGSATVLTPSAPVTWDDAEGMDYAWTLARSGTTWTLTQIGTTTKSVSWTHAAAADPGHIVLMIHGGLAVRIAPMTYSGAATAWGGALASNPGIAVAPIDGALTYAFARATSSWPGAAPSGVTEMSARAKAGVRSALARWASLTGLAFTEVADTVAASIRFYMSSALPAGTGALTTPAGAAGKCNVAAGTSDIDTSGSSWAADTSYNWLSMAHEAGHCLGLGHSPKLASSNYSTNSIMNGTEPSKQVGGIKAADVEGVALVYGIDPGGDEPSRMSFRSTPTGALSSVSATTTLSFVLGRTGGLSSPSSVQYAVTAGASPGVSADDFAPAALPSGTATFAAGSDTTTIVVTLAAKAPPSSAEAAVLTLSAPSGGTIQGPASASFTLLPGTGSQIYLRSAPTGARPSAAATTPLSFVLGRTGGLESAVSVRYEVTAGTAPGVTGDDFSPAVLPLGIAAFPAGSDTATISISLAAKAAPAEAEAAVLTLSAPSGDTIAGSASVSFSLLPAAAPTDDTSVSVSLPPLSARPDPSGVVSIPVTLSRAGDLTEPSSLAYVVTGAGDPAAQAGDFDGGSFPSGRIEFAGGPVPDPTVVTLRYATDAFVTDPVLDDPAGEPIPGRLQARFAIRRALAFDGDGGTLGSVASLELTGGEVYLDNRDHALDGLPDLYALVGREARVLIADRGPLLSPIGAGDSPALLWDDGAGHLLPWDDGAGRPVAWRAGEAGIVGGPAPGLSAFRRIFRGRVTSFAPDGDAVRIGLEPDLRRLDSPVQTETFDGKGGFGGTEALTGRTKPRCLGHNEGVEAELIDPFRLIYMVDAGAVLSIPQVYDKAVPLTLAGDYETYEQLAAAAQQSDDGDDDFEPEIPAGSYATCTAAGVFRLGVQAAGRVTANVNGSGTAVVSEVAWASGRRWASGRGWLSRRLGSYASGARHQCERLLTEFAGFDPEDVDSEQILHLGGLDPDGSLDPSCGLFLATNSGTTVREALGRLAKSAGVVLFQSRFGVWQCRPLAVPATPDVTLDETNMTADLRRQGLPYRAPFPKIRVAFKRNWTTMSATDVAPLASQEDRAFATRDASYAERTDSGVAKLYPTAEPAQVEAVLADESAALALGATYAGFYGDRRRGVWSTEGVMGVFGTAEFFCGVRVVADGMDRVMLAFDVEEDAADRSVTFGGLFG